MKILYLPIIEPGAFHEVALKNKRGLLDALRARGHDVHQFDYLDYKAPLYDMLSSLVVDFEPDLLLTQFHGPDRISPGSLNALRTLNPKLRIVNWSGDSWRHSLTSDGMMDLCRAFDLQLVASPDALPDYEAAGIHARYWQIAYEKPVGELPDMPAYDVVFLGNVISDKRRAMLEMLRALPYRVGIYGDWEHADGHNTYDFGQGEALYKNAKLAIADNAYPDTQNYISNRPFQILMAGGALMLHEHVPTMEELSGLRRGVHYSLWSNLEHLRERIDFWLDDSDIVRRPKEGRAIRAECGQAYAREHHTYDQRVAQLLDEYLPELEAIK